MAQNSKITKYNIILLAAGAAVVCNLSGCKSYVPLQFRPWTFQRRPLTRRTPRTSGVDVGRGASGKVLWTMKYPALMPSLHPSVPTKPSIISTKMATVQSLPPSWTRGCASWAKHLPKQRYDFLFESDFMWFSMFHWIFLLSNSGYFLFLWFLWIRSLSSYFRFCARKIDREDDPRDRWKWRWPDHSRGVLQDVVDILSQQHSVSNHQKDNL